MIYVSPAECEAIRRDTATVRNALNAEIAAAREAVCEAWEGLAQAHEELASLTTASGEARNECR